MKTIIITSFHSIISRNILQTKILDLLKEEDLNIIILTPPHKVEFFRGLLNDVDVVGVDFPVKKGRDFFKLFSISLIGIENLFIRRIISDKSYAKVFFAYLNYYIFRHMPFVKEFVRFIDRVFFTTISIQSVFDTYNPDLVFVTDIYFESDKEVLKESKKRNIPNIGMVRSWDNVTTKGVLLVEPDKIIVHNKILRNELMQRYNIPKNNIVVSGIPHYDNYGKQRNITHEEFCKKMGLNPSKKIILFAPGGKILFKDDSKLLKLFKELIDENKFKKNVQFLVRLPPGDDINLHDFEPDENFIFDKPGVGFGNGRKENEMSSSDENHLANSLYYSDVVITLVSTIVIDSAAFNKPTIVISFNPKENEDEVQKFSKYSHFRKFLSFDFCKLALNEKDFIDTLNIYLNNSQIDKEKRSGIVDKYCYKLDGKSSERVAKVLIDSLQ